MPTSKKKHTFSYLFCFFVFNIKCLAKEKMIVINAPSFQGKRGPAHVPPEFNPMPNLKTRQLQKVSKSPTALSRLPILRNWTATETLPRSPNRKHRTAQSIPCPKSTKPSLRTVKTKDTEAVARIPAASGTAILKDWKNERFYKRTPQETPLPQRLRDTTLQSILSRCLKKSPAIAPKT